MNDFNKKFKSLTDQFPFISFVEAKINADRFKVDLTLYYKKENEKEYYRSRGKILDIVRKMLPPSSYVNLVSVPAVLSLEGIINQVMGLLRKESMFVFSVMNPKRICIDINSEPIVVDISLPITVYDYAIEQKLVEKLKEYLEERYFVAFNVKFILDTSEKPNYARLNEKPYRPKYTYDRPEEGRRINPIGRTKGCGEIIEEKAMYICDCINTGYVTIYGTISDLSIKEYTPKHTDDPNKKRKFAKFTLDDTTGRIKCIFFPGEKSESSIKFLENSRNIIAGGYIDIDERMNDGTLQFRMIKFSGCERAEFTINNVVRMVDDNYRLIKPEKYVSVQQTDIYGYERKPLTDDPLVIFSLLTTLQSKANYGEVIEIAAIKMLNGRLEEKFHTFIKPKSRLSDEQYQNLGIMENNLAGCPDYTEVMPDFYKFYYGCMLTAVPLDKNAEVLNDCLGKLHIPEPPTINITKYIPDDKMKTIKIKNPFKIMEVVETYAKILGNVD